MGLGVMQGLDVIMAFFDGGLAGTAQCGGLHFYTTLLATILLVVLIDRETK